MSKTANIQDIKGHIQKDVKACKALLALLDAEREALKDRKPDDLEAIITDKLSNLQQLEASAQQRSEWVSVAPNAEQSQEQRWLTLLDSLDPALKGPWQELQALFKDCQHQNEVNGKVLARNQQVFKRLLGMMRGQSEPQDLYTQMGSRSNGGWQQTIGEA